MEKSRNLQKRLVEFAIETAKFSRSIQKTYDGKNLANQLVRSSSSTALNYGEAQEAESKKDFIHKMTIVLKELRETYSNLEIIEGTRLCPSNQSLRVVKNECNELIAIFVIRIKTAKSREDFRNKK